MFIETKKLVQRELKVLMKIGVPEHSIKMIELQVDRAVNKRKLARMENNKKLKSQKYQRSLNELCVAVNLCSFARKCL